jgi:dimethylhistidine N-methyltransferase
MLTRTNARTHQGGFIHAYRHDNPLQHTEISAGLLAPQAFTSPKYLYDALGSKLFEAICELPEYYPTRTEASIFDRYAPEIAEAVGHGTTMIDLGAGNCAKAAKLFPALQPRQYVPIDISVDFLWDAITQLRQRFPHIVMTGVGMDFSSTLDLPDVVGHEKRLFFYPGSSIGNFTPMQALAFLRRMRAACKADGRVDGGLLIGVDLIKDKSVLDAAYDDELGVTAAFNLNVLRHLNKLLEADFELRQWQHRGFFNTELNRIEMHLQARSDVRVTWNGGERWFEKGETIHTENSYKYTRESFVQLLAQAKFEVADVWTDVRGWFMVAHARAV